MKYQIVLFVSSSFLILVLFYVAESYSPLHEGSIESISRSPDRLSIKVTGWEVPLIVFDVNEELIKEGDQVRFSGSFETYKGEKQFVVDKIIQSVR